MAADRILVVGLPRSGTTWAGRALGAAAHTRSVAEPDNEDNFAYAVKGKRGLGRYPVVEPGVAPPAGYAALWAGAFAGGRTVTGPLTALSDGLHGLVRKGTSVHERHHWGPLRRTVLGASVALARPGAPAPAKNVVVKSVFSAFALRWICERFAPRLVVVTRGPLNTVASWRRLGWDPPLLGHPVLGWPDVDTALLARLLPERTVPPPPPHTDLVRRTAWELCVLMAAVLDAAAAHPGAIVVRHEELCVDPEDRFRDLYARLGLEWTEQTGGYLRESNAPGAGAYDTRRVAQEEPTRWRSRLSDDEVRAVQETVAAFDIDW